MTIFRLLSAAATLAAAAGIAFAQPGSTGGSLGDAGESISGGGSTPPRRPAGESAPATPSNVMDGTWHVSQDCNTGRYEILLTLRHTSPTTFAGSGKGLTTGASTTIQEGRVSGRQVSLSRKVALGIDVWEARLAPDGRSFSGTAVSRLWNCTFTAARR